MPRCRDGKGCIDDLCHNGGETLCGLTWGVDLSFGSGEWIFDGDEDDSPYEDGYLDDWEDA